MMRERCRYDLELFAKFFFPTVCRLDWSLLHRYLIERRGAKIAETPPERRGCIDVVIAPRGAAKSSLVSLVFPIHAILYGIDPYIILISATDRQAKARLANIRDCLLTGERLKEFFADELADWPRNAQATIVMNGVRIDAFSAGSELRGLTFGAWRPTWIVLDDVESSARVLSSNYREGLVDWMNEVIENLGNGYTNIDLIGTLLHPQALPARLSERPDVKARKFRSILAEARRQTLWDAWRARFFDLTDPDRLEHARAFYEANKAAMLEGARVLWRAKESYYDLQVMRETRGRAAFNKEKQNAPLVDGETIFPISKLARFAFAEGRLTMEEATTSTTVAGAMATTGAKGGEAAEGPRSVPVEELRFFGFLDPAMGESKTRGRSRRSDFAAIATVGVDRHGYLYAMDVWLERAGPSRQIEKILQLHEQWGYTEFGIEINAFQKLLLEPLEAERTRRREAGRPWRMAVRGVKHRANKNQRIIGLEPLVGSGWLLFADDLCEEFLNQLGDFPRGRHDDGPDALQAAVALARSASLDLRLLRVGKRGGGRRARSY